MRLAGNAPRLHLFVCANHRDATSPLGAGCGARGEALYDELKRGVAARGAFTTIWVTKTHCLGVCPKDGATVATYGSTKRGEMITEVTPADASALLAL